MASLFEFSEPWSWTEAAVRVALAVLPAGIGLATAMRVRGRTWRSGQSPLLLLASGALAIESVTLVAANAVAFTADRYYVIYPWQAFAFPSVADIGLLLDSAGWLAIVLRCFAMVRSDPRSESGRLWWSVLAVWLVFALYIVLFVTQPVAAYKEPEARNWPYAIATSAYAFINSAGAVLAGILLFGRSRRRVAASWRIVAGLVCLGMLLRTAGDVAVAFAVASGHGDPGVRLWLVPAGAEWTPYTLGVIALGLAVLGMSREPPLHI